MRGALKLTLIVAVPAGLSGMSAEAQTSAEAGRAISTVMNHRVAWLADSLRFNACSVRRAMNGSADFASHIIEPVRGLLDDAAASCPREGRSDRTVLVDSLRFSDTTAHVYLTVLRGELVHRESYTMARNRSSAAYMPIRDVRLWGHGQAYRGRAAPGTAPRTAPRTGENPSSSPNTEVPPGTGWDFVHPPRKERDQRRPLPVPPVAGAAGWVPPGAGAAAAGAATSRGVRPPRAPRSRYCAMLAG